MPVVLATSVLGDGAARGFDGVEEEEELCSFVLDWWTGTVVAGLGMLVEVLVVGLMKVLAAALVNIDCCDSVAVTTPLVLYPALVVGVLVHSHPVTVQSSGRGGRDGTGFKWSEGEQCMCQNVQQATM